MRRASWRIAVVRRGRSLRRSKITQLNTHDMADKIKGWVDQFMVPPHQRERNENITVQDHKWLSGDRQCTLVVTDERVFTESDVKAILRDLLAAAEDGPFMPNYDRMDEMVKFHGLSFDPA